jgi:hypothetical protein
METVKIFTLEIPFANTTARNNAKKLGAKWDANNKVWTVETTEYKLRLRNIDRFIQEPKAATATIEAPKTLDLGVGFPVQNNAKAISNAYKFGYDAIEM